jgi:hypothetical protein
MVPRPTRMAAFAAFAAFATAAAPGRAAAQGWLTLGTNDSTVRRMAPRVPLAVTVLIDMSHSAGESIDALSSSVAWNPAFIALDSIHPGAFGDLSNIDSVRTAGTLSFDASSDTPVTATTTLATLYFSAGATTGGTRLAFTATDASLAGVHLATGALVGWSQDICVALPGVWGDVDADGAATIIDAQQVARSVVGATVVDSTRLANNGDVNGDGEVDILDAQGIARYSVQLTAPARIGAQRSVPPSVQTLTMNKASLSLPLGTTSALVATPFDADGFTMVGCQTSTWKSSAPSIVRVNGTGQVTAVTSGSATITATSGTATAQSVVTVP